MGHSQPLFCLRPKAKDLGISWVVALVSFIFVFSNFSTVDSKQIILDLNYEPLEEQTTALPTEPQPLPIFDKDFMLVYQP